VGFTFPREEEKSIGVKLSQNGEKKAPGRKKKKRKRATARHAPELRGGKWKRGGGGVRSLRARLQNGKKKKKEGKRRSPALLFGPQRKKKGSRFSTSCDEKKKKEKEDLTTPVLSQSAGHAKKRKRCFSAVVEPRNHPKKKGEEKGGKASPSYIIIGYGVVGGKKGAGPLTRRVQPTVERKRKGERGFAAWLKSILNPALQGEKKGGEEQAALFEITSMRSA